MSSLLFALLLRGKKNSQSMKDFTSSRKNIAGTSVKPLEQWFLRLAKNPQALMGNVGRIYTFFGERVGDWPLVFKEPNEAERSP